MIPRHIVFYVYTLCIDVILEDFLRVFSTRFIFFSAFYNFFCFSDSFFFCAFTNYELHISWDSSNFSPQNWTFSSIRLHILCDLADDITWESQDIFHQKVWYFRHKIFYFNAQTLSEHFSATFGTRLEKKITWWGPNWEVFLSPSVPHCCGVWEVWGGPLIRPIMVPRDASLSNSCTSDRCNNSGIISLYNSTCINYEPDRNVWL